MRIDGNDVGRRRVERVKAWAKQQDCEKEIGHVPRTAARRVEWQ